MAPRLEHDDVFRRLCAAREHARAHHAEPVTLDALARRAAMSRYHFLRAFRRAFGETPHDYLTSVRLDRAKELLRADAASVTDVCLEVGFSSLGSFSTLFSRHVGQSPSAWRRESRALVQVPARLVARHVPHCYASFFAGV